MPISIPFFEYDFLLRALIAGVIIGFVTANLGVFVVLRKMAFFSDAIAHASLTGIALGLLIGIHPFLGAVGVSVLVAVGIVALQKRTAIPVDTIIGVFFSATLAVGVLIIGLLKGYRTDLFGFLFGDILGVSVVDLWLLGVIGVVTMLLLFLRYRTWLKIAFHKDLAEVEGLRVSGEEYLFMIALALVIALGIKLVGIILIGSLVVIPAAAAKNMSANFRTMFVFSGLIGVASAVLGLVASYAIDAAAGPMIVVVSTIFFAVSLLFRR